MYKYYLLAEIEILNANDELANRTAYVLIFLRQNTFGFITAKHDFIYVSFLIENTFNIVIKHFKVFGFNEINCGQMLTILSDGNHERCYGYSSSMIL